MHAGDTESECIHLELMLRTTTTKKQINSLKKKQEYLCVMLVDLPNSW